MKKILISGAIGQLEKYIKDASLDFPEIEFKTKEGPNIEYKNSAKVILQHTRQFDTTKLAKTEEYRTFAARPKFSVLDTKKFKNIFNKQLIDWRESLSKLLFKD